MDSKTSRSSTPIEPCPVIKFDERPALDHATASEQLEHLYIHIDLTQNKLNEVIARLAALEAERGI